MILLIFVNEVGPTVEIITAIPKLLGTTVRERRAMLLPVAKEFVAKRVVGWGQYACKTHGVGCDHDCFRDDKNAFEKVDPYPRYLSDYEVSWEYWEERGIAFSQDQDYLIYAVDADRSHPGCRIGPAWRGIRSQPCPVTDWLAGGVELIEGDE